MKPWIMLDMIGVRRLCCATIANELNKNKPRWTCKLFCMPMHDLDRHHEVH